MPDPAVTFVIPCYNHGRFVGEAVRSALAQQGARVQVVVVDDGSDDGSTPDACDACAGECVTIIHQPNRGLPAARNRGASGADTPYLVFLDADDYVRPRFTRTLHDALVAADDSVSHAYCQEQLVGLGHGVWRVPEWDVRLLKVTNLHPVTCLVRRDRFEAVGGFNESMTGGYEDWDLWLSFAERGWRGVRVREPLFVWRRHSHDTMVMNVIHDHERLYGALVEQHPALYEPDLRDLLIYTNTLLRKFNMNWIDETGLPRELQYLNQVRDEYQRSAAIRLARRLNRRVDALPAPLRKAARWMLARVRSWAGD